MARSHPQTLFERYANEVICHCDSQAQAEGLRADLEQRLAECGLQLNPQKTRVVYCADANQHGDHPQRQFDFLRYTFKPRAARNRQGKVFTNFTPAVADKAATAMRGAIRAWCLARQTRHSLRELLGKVRPIGKAGLATTGCSSPLICVGCSRTWMHTSCSGPAASTSR
jgi:hypothetical protein